jgi:hypothetical protein
MKKSERDELRGLSKELDVGEHNPLFSKHDVLKLLDYVDHIEKQNEEIRQALKIERNLVDRVEELEAALRFYAEEYNFEFEQDSWKARIALKGSGE